MNQLVPMLSQYRLNELLAQLSGITREMVQQNKPTREIDVKVKNAMSMETHRIIVSAWGLLDLAYLAICHTSDSAPKSPTTEETNGLYLEYLRYDEETTSNLSENADLPTMFLYMFGLAQKSFWFQELHRIRDQFCREVELLEVIPGQVSSKVDVNSIVAAQTGYPIKSYRKLLVALHGLGLSGGTLERINVDPALQKYDRHMTEKDLRRVIEFYSADYSQCAKSELKQQFLYVKPIVKTSSSAQIVVNQYLLAKKMVDGPFWVLRDHFMTKGKDESRAFTTEFGRYFEKYVENLLGFYLKTSDFAKVPESREKRADWIVNTRTFQLIVEQKSSLMSITLRDTTISRSQIETYMETLRTGLYQLRETADAYRVEGKTQVKLLLHYDQLFLAENVLKTLILQMPPADLTDDYYLIHIGDFEHLIQLLAEDEVLFDKVIEHKIDHSRPASEGKEFWQIIPQYYHKGNLYTKTKLNHFTTYLKS